MGLNLRKSGGFLNNVAGAITDYRWTDESPSKEGPVPFKAGKVKGQDGKLKEKFHTLYFELHARADGATEDVQTSLFAGGFEDYNVSEDGKTLTALKDGEPVSIGEDTGAGKFLASVLDAGMPASDFDEDPTTLNVEPIVGKRFRFVQRRDEKATKEFGKRKDKKTGREYDRTDLTVDEYYGAAEVAATPARSTTTSKSAPSTKTTSPSKVVAAAAPAAKATNGRKTAGVAAAASTIDIAGLSERTLMNILTSAPNNQITKQKALTKILQLSMKDAELKENREEVGKFLFDDDKLEAIDGVSYDRASGVISVA